MTTTHATTRRRLIDVRAVAERLGCSTRHVYRMADGGLMPRPVRVGRRMIRWDETALEAWIAAGCPPVDIARRRRA